MASMFYTETTAHALKERIKELECLYSIAKLTTDNDLTLEELLQRAVNYLPPGFQFPEITSACITCKGKSYKTDNFRKTKWKLVSRIGAGDNDVGSVEVYYLKKTPQSIKDPFLKEEKKLIRSISSLLGVFIKNRLIDEELHRLKGAIASSLSGVVFADMKSNLTYVNESFLRMWGYDSEKEVLGKNAKEFGRWKSRVAKVTDAVTKEGRWTGDLKGLRKDGTEFDIHLTAGLVFDRSGSPVGRIACIQDITEQKRTEAELKKSQKELRGLAAHLQNLREEERGRMASRIHGELGQILTVLKTDLSLLSQKVSTDQKENHALIKEIKKTIDQTIQTVQKISTELRPRLIDEVGLVEAVRWQAKEFQKHTGIKCELSLSEKDMNPDKRTSIVLFRILQEALTNVARHAEATRVTVNLSAKPNALSLKIKDNGKGISEDRLSSLTSFGILGIKESVLSLAGKVEIMGIPDKGTTVKLSLPLKNRIGDG